jgi:hypothetical protein
MADWVWQSGPEVDTGLDAPLLDSVLFSVGRHTAWWHVKEVMMKLGAQSQLEAWSPPPDGFLTGGQLHR